MNGETVTTLLLEHLGVYGTALFAILSILVTMGVAYLAFKFGWSKILSVLNDSGSNRDNFDEWYDAEKMRLHRKYRK